MCLNLFPFVEKTHLYKCILPDTTWLCYFKLVITLLCNLSGSWFLWKIEDWGSLYCTGGLLHDRCVRKNWHLSVCIGPIANLKGHYFQPSLSVCLSVCLWLALLPFNVNRFWRNLVTRTLLWCSLAVTIMVQIGHRGTTHCLLKISTNSEKSQNSNFKILVHHFLRMCLLCIVKNWTRFKQNWRRR